MNSDTHRGDPPELVVGLVSPVGMNTTDLANSVQRSLSDCGYLAVVIKLSSLLPAAGDQPPGEAEDRRIRRLMSGGNRFWVQLLRSIYGEQFILIGSQGSVAQRTRNLLQRNISGADGAAKEAAVAELFRIDAHDPESFGQNVIDTYPQADFFVRNNDSDDIDRAITLLFGAPTPPTVGEYAMYMARASRARSLAASRKVGAAIVVDGFVVSTGYNDVPEGQSTDIAQGIDTSEQFKRDNVRDTLERLHAAGMLAEGVDADDNSVTKAADVLKKGALMSTIEYQRAVHAEARAIDEATIRGISPAGGVLYVTTFPCHLCYKHALSVRLDHIEYIEPYPKSRAVEMFDEGADDKLVPFTGVAPRRFMAIFDERPAPLSVPPGIFEPYNRRAATPPAWPSTR
ncbi:deaminase [Mycobacterium marinum]|uniref:deaminase n=1 Tax=Mycobacterium marinum TaxID=1781 RepID=UPI0012DFC579|nr:deaminase [Mycobacterium marinum]